MVNGAYPSSTFWGLQDEQFLHGHKPKSNLFGHTHKCNKFKEKLFSHIIQSHSFLIFLHL